ncbi:DUF3304 domain-containing protein [Burkholderia metallica]|uniref:DUF3304 domain-containing protein n=1 Tax=Burkholderia metallica TaxID=488729 RepID=UPI000841D347|nr:hypothetical protein WJ16_02010 [Burkholderia metallica]
MTWRRSGWAVGLLAVAASLSACGKSEPTYSGISVMGRNYLPYNMNGFTIIDAYGNQASGGGDDPPGAGGGSVACCYTLKGTEFTVKWKYYDADRWTMDDSHAQQVETKVVMPSSAVPEKVGNRILEVHFYPDRHVEFQFPGQLLDESRIPVVDVSRWMAAHYQEQLAKKFDDTDGQSHRRIARAVAAAWLKYRLTDPNDLEQYAYYDLLVNSRFDTHPEIQRVLQAAGGKPGTFAKSMQSLPKSVLLGLTSDNFEPVTVPAIPDGLLPSPRAEDALRVGTSPTRFAM